MARSVGHSRSRSGTAGLRAPFPPRAKQPDQAADSLLADGRDATMSLAEARPKKRERHRRRDGGDRPRRARGGAPAGAATTAEKNKALAAMAAAIRERTRKRSSPRTRSTSPTPGRPGVTASFIDRLTLTPKRIEAMATGIEEIAALPDPVGTVIAAWDRPNGLHIERVRTPLGVIGIIYESRPNVTADAGALCLKAGNAAILRGGSDSFRSSAAIHPCLVAGLTSRRACPRRRSRSCRPATAPPSG